MKQWIQEQDEVLDDSMISADALSDLSTEDNCISTWCVGEKSEGEIRKAVLALVSDFRSLEDIKIVFLSDTRLADAGLMVKKSPGKTKIQQYAELHRDIVSLNAGTLQKLAKVILESVWGNDTQMIYKETITKWILEALNEGILEFDSLNKNFRQGFASSVKKLGQKGKINKTDIDESVLEAIEKQLLQNKRKTNCKFEEECERYRKAS